MWRICQPMHTDQTDLDDTVHSAYEDTVDNLTTSPAAVQGWAVFTGYHAPGNVRSFAIALASASHKDYAALVQGYAARGWDDSEVQAITRRSLNRAANALADVLIALKKGAPGGGSSGGGGGGGGSTQTLAHLSASVSESHPAQYSDVTARAKCTDASGTPISGVAVTFTWHYKTTTPVENAASDSSGIASCTRSIGRASSGYYVSIAVTAVYRGVSKTARTGFTPQ